MKKIIITSAFILSAFAGFSQQTPAPAPARKLPTPEQVAQRQANALSQRLSLTEEQRAKAYNIYLEKAKKDQATREARMKEMQKLRDQALAERKQETDKISQLLNPDQKKSFQDMQSRMQNRIQGWGPSGMRPGQQQRGFQRGAGGRFQRPGNPGFRQQPAPGRQFQRPAVPGSRFQQGPGTPFQRRNRLRRFQRRFGPGAFQQGPADPNFRQELRERFQNRMNRFQQQQQAAPDNSQSNKL